METFKIIYKDLDDNIKSQYVQADHASEAISNAEDDIWDLKEVVRVEQL